MSLEEMVELLCRACDRPLTPDTELLESGYLDSLAMVLLEEEWEAQGESMSVARIPHDAMHTARTLWEWYCENRSE